VGKARKRDLFEIEESEIIEKRAGKMARPHKESGKEGMEGEKILAISV
jgi:hypothetical protein